MRQTLAQTMMYTLMIQDVIRQSVEMAYLTQEKNATTEIHRMETDATAIVKMNAGKYATLTNVTHITAMHIIAIRMTAIAGSSAREDHA